jgi:hypothetical protein
MDFCNFTRGCSWPSLPTLLWAGGAPVLSLHSTRQAPLAGCEEQVAGDGCKHGERMGKEGAT